MDIKSIKKPFFEGRAEKKGKHDQKVSLSTCDVQTKPHRETSSPEVLRWHKSNFVCAHKDAGSIYVYIYPGIRSLLKIFIQTDLLLAQSPAAKRLGCSQTNFNPASLKKNLF